MKKIIIKKNRNGRANALLFCKDKKKVPSDYYDKPLEYRRDCLGASTIHYLCKSMIVENIECTEKDCHDKFNSKFY